MTTQRTIETPRTISDETVSFIILEFEDRIKELEWSSSRLVINELFKIIINEYESRLKCLESRIKALEEAPQGTINRRNDHV